MESNLVHIAVSVAFIFMMLALLLALFRLIIGPTMHDRIAAMDLMSSITIGFILLYSAMIQKDLYIDIAIVISLISFIGTVAISTFLKLKYSKND